MSDPSLGLTMLGLIVVAIMMGFPTAFTLMGLGMIFGYLVFWAPGQHWYNNQIFDLIVQRTYGVMTNDTLLSVPLFVFMGYVMERAALVDRMFHSVQLAFRRVPASLAVTTLLVCAFWGIASGIVGAVVVLMGVIAMRPMLNAGYDVKLAAGAITAGGTLGILIPPSVMLIVYAAVAGQSIVKLYAAAMLPGLFLTALYLAYILGWALLNPKIAPKLRPDQYRIAVPEWLQRLERGRSRSVVPGLIASIVQPGRLGGIRAADGRPVGYGTAWRNVLAILMPVVLVAGTFGMTWWYVIVYNAPAVAAPAVPSAPRPAPVASAAKPAEPTTAPAAGEEHAAGARGRGRVGVGSEHVRRAEGPTRGDDHAGRAHVLRAWQQDPGALLRVVLGAGRARRTRSRRLPLAHGRRAARDPEGADRVGRAARGADGCGARRDPVRHHHRHRVGGHRGSGRLVPGGDGEIRASGLVVEPGRLPRRRGARLVAGRELHVVAGGRGDRGGHAGDRGSRPPLYEELAGAAEEPEGSDVPHRQDHGHGVLALRGLGAVLFRVRPARRASR